MLSFFPRDVLDEIWDLIESVSEGFPTYFCQSHSHFLHTSPTKAACSLAKATSISIEPFKRSVNCLHVSEKKNKLE